MPSFKILLSNLGYARGINGQLAQHILRAHRHLYCSPLVQKKSLQQLSTLIEAENPDLCCFVEIDKGSFTSAGFNQLEALISKTYPFFAIDNKYAPISLLRSFFITKGKSLALISKRQLTHEKLFFRSGTKRLIYKVDISSDLTLFFAHFSLKKSVRAKQLLEARDIMDQAQGEVIFLGDFNILNGLNELKPLLEPGRFLLLNSEDKPTFTFHKRKLLLDLCICSKGVAEQAQLKVIPQLYSDHAALLLEIRRERSK